MAVYVTLNIPKLISPTSLGFGRNLLFQIDKTEQKILVNFRGVV